MQKHVFTVLVGVIAGGLNLGTTVTAQKGGSTKQTATELQTTLRDRGAQPDGTPADAIWSDGFSYQTDAAQKTSNTLTATTAANFMLDTFTATRGTPVRCINIDLHSYVVAQNDTIPADGCVAAEFSSLSFFSDSTDSLRSMVEGQLVVKRVAVGWEAGGMQYHLRFKGQTVDLGEHAGTHELANIGFTCEAADGAGCLTWTAEPVRCDVAQTSGPYSSLTNCDWTNRLAVLERRSTKGSATPEMIAVVDVPFAMTIHRR